MTEKREIALTINGRRYDVRVDPRRTLVDAIRDDCGQTGTHVGCEHGVCGACTVLLDGEPVRSCLMLAVQANGRSLRTVEGLAPTGELTPLQRAFNQKHALQCGFCTAGFLMTIEPFLRDHPDPEPDEIREALAGNLCRCTGYHGIIEAVEAAAREQNTAAPSHVPSANSDANR